MKIRAISTLEAGGARFLGVLSGPADQKAALARVRDAERTLGPVAGILHGAGSSATGRLRALGLIDASFCRQSLETGVTSLVALDAMFRERALDFRYLMTEQDQASASALQAGVHPREA